MARVLFILIMLLLPFAVIESVTKTNLILETLGKVFPSFDVNRMKPRWGLNRAQTAFEHAILFGVFCGSAIGLTFYVVGHGKSLVARVARLATVVGAAVFSLSAGPLVAITSQLGFIFWDLLFRRMRHHWLILGALLVAGFVAVDLLSNRTPFHVIASYLSFSEHTAYNRIRIWEFGSQSIFNNPLIGISYASWDRPYWMSDSIDMFWIVPAVRHGIPVWIMYFLMFFSITITVARRKGFDARLRDYRTGWLVSMAGLFVVGWTVHFWNATFVLFLFLLGSGAWMADPRATRGAMRAPEEQAGGAEGTRRTWL